MKTIVKAITIPAIGGFTLGLGFLAGSAMASGISDYQTTSRVDDTCVTEEYTPPTNDGSLIDVNADANVGGNGNGDGGLLDVDAGVNVGSDNSGHGNNGGNTGNNGNSGNNGGTPPGNNGGNHSNNGGNDSLIDVDVDANVGDESVSTDNGNNGNGSLIDVDANVGVGNDNGNGHDRGLVPELLDSLL